MKNNNKSHDRINAFIKFFSSPFSRSNSKDYIEASFRSERNRLLDGINPPHNTPNKENRPNQPRK